MEHDKEENENTSDFGRGIVYLREEYKRLIIKIIEDDTPRKINADLLNADLPKFLDSIKKAEIKQQIKEPKLPEYYAIAHRPKLD